MKNKEILFGTLVMVLIFGMTVIGCDDGSDSRTTYFYESRVITMEQYNQF